MEGALAAYAVGVVASLSLAMAMSLENAWLTVALSLQLPAIGWIHERTKVGPLRAVAMLLAAIILGRLVLNPEIFDYGLTATPGLNWMFYGYGIPTIAFYVASRLFRRRADDALVHDAGIGRAGLPDPVRHHGNRRHRAGRRVPAGRQPAGGEPQDHRMADPYRWRLLYQCRAKMPRAVAVWGWQILALLSGGHIVAVHLIALNPLLFGGSVGSLLDLQSAAAGLCRPGRLRGDVSYGSIKAATSFRTGHRGA